MSFGRVTLERQILFWGLGLVGLLLIVYLLGSTITPFAAGIVLGYLLDPVVLKLQRFGFSRLGAAAAIVERANPEIGRRLRRGRRTMASRRVDTAGVRWGGAIQFSVAPHRHARLRLLYSRRLAQDDR